MERLGWRMRLTGAKPDTLELMTGIKERRFFEKGTTGVQVRLCSHTTAAAAAQLTMMTSSGLFCGCMMFRHQTHRMVVHHQQRLVPHLSVCSVCLRS
jgi:hypothetical protein